MDPEVLEELCKPLRDLSLHDVELTGEELGRGAYGVVLEVKVSGFSCAGKKLHDAIAGEFLVKSFVKECVYHSQLRHPNIVQFMGVYFPPDSTIPILVMERLQLSLAHCLDEATLPLRLKYSILLDVANGLNYFHHRTPPIIHRDLTAQNVLLTKSFTAKIADLGVSRIIDPGRPRSHTNVPGNPAVMPPEAFDDQPYDYKLDVFSYGCLIIHTFNQEWPFPVSQLSIDPLCEWQRRFPHFLKMGMCHPLIPVTRSCMNDDPAKRPDMSYLIYVIESTSANLPDDTRVGDLDHLYDMIIEKKKQKSAVSTESETSQRLRRDAWSSAVRSKNGKGLSFSCEDIHSAANELGNQEDRDPLLEKVEIQNPNLQDDVHESPRGFTKFLTQVSSKVFRQKRLRLQSSISKFTTSPQRQQSVEDDPPVLHHSSPVVVSRSRPQSSQSMHNERVSQIASTNDDSSPVLHRNSPILIPSSLQPFSFDAEPTCPNTPPITYKPRSQFEYCPIDSARFTIPQRQQSVEDDPPVLRRSSPVVVSRSRPQSSQSMHNKRVSQIAPTNDDYSPVLHRNSPVWTPSSLQPLSFDAEPTCPNTPPIFYKPRSQLGYCPIDSACSKSPLSSPILPNKFTFSPQKVSSPHSSNDRKIKQKDEQQHELMFNLDECTTSSNTRSLDLTKVLPSLNKSEVATPPQSLHDSREVTPFQPNSPRWTMRQSNPHEWYHHKISNATAEVILLERERKNGNFIVHSNSNGEFYLSVCFEQKIIHIRINKDTNEKFSLDGIYCNNEKSFDDLDELVNYYREIPLVVEDRLIELKLLNDL